MQKISDNNWKELIADITKTLLSPIIIVGAFWYVTHDLKTDINRIEITHREDIKQNEQHHREDIKQVNERIEKSEEKWLELFKQFHTLDKNSSNKG